MDVPSLTLPTNKFGGFTPHHGKRCNIQVPSRKTVLAGHLGSPLNGLSVLCLWCMEICQGEDHISPVTPEERGWITLYLNN